MEINKRDTIQYTRYKDISVIFYEIKSGFIAENIVVIYLCAPGT